LSALLLASKGAIKASVDKTTQYRSIIV